MKKFLFLLLTAVTVLIISCGDDDKKENPVCNNKCDVVGATRCAADGKGFDKCTKETDTCNVWKKTECSGEEVCVKVGDVAGCGTNGGDDNVTDCSKDANACAANTNGKTECKEGVCSTPESHNVTDCTSDTDCANNTDGTTVCKDDGLCGEPSDEVRCTSDADCANASNGKTVCKGDGLCGFPTQGCSNPCEEDESGTTQCDGDMLQTCTLKTDLNCYNWDDTTDCSAEGKVCDDMAVAMCVADVK